MSIWGDTIFIQQQEGDDRPDSLAPWRAFRSFEPIARGQTVLLPSDHISRATPRVLLAANQLCVAMEGFRKAPAPAR